MRERRRGLLAAVRGALDAQVRGFVWRTAHQVYFDRRSESTSVFACILCGRCPATLRNWRIQCETT